MSTKTCFTSIFALACLFSCQESIEQRAAREAARYTRRFCPTPFINNIRTDSVTFSQQKRTFTYHCTFSAILDDKEIIAANRSKINDMLLASIRESTSMKPYIEAGFHFTYMCRSEKNPKELLIQAAF